MPFGDGGRALALSRGCLHGSGGPYAQRLVARKQYHMEAANQRSLSAIGLTAAEPGD